ncbi:glycosyltransferase [Motiliproteus sp. SC1-56]|uniref:glycosyltransferase n=1 Tax=Motiliproteus sp. SC1-56 TaxID=2799565 RepID=UPI001A90BC4A|nr:glycosyltransferase [Motiliproteus sp. SC1-56]
MKVVFLAAASSIHTARWVNALCEAGLDIHLISQHPVTQVFDKRVCLHVFPYRGSLGYFLIVHKVKKIIKDVNPDLVNAHYASGYGTTARLLGFSPCLLSVWGSDVYDFPQKSVVHRFWLRSNLRSAQAIASTSHSMAKETAKTYKSGNVFITPFGIDETVFYPVATQCDRRVVTIGTVKTLSYKYGVDDLIKAFSITASKYPDGLLRLVMAGDGPDVQKLKDLALTLGVSSLVDFRGYVSHSEVPAVLNELDIYVALSRFESFGVAILEASACGLPVVVSDADGPAEVTWDGVTGIVVGKNSPEQASAALCRLIDNPSERVEMGRAGREHVLKHYTWSASVDTMLDAYKKTILLGANKGH